MSKTQYITQMRSTVNDLVKSLDQARNLYNDWFKRGYGTGGALEITEAEVDEVEPDIALADIVGG